MKCIFLQLHLNQDLESYYSLLHRLDPESLVLRLELKSNRNFDSLTYCRLLGKTLLTWHISCLRSTTLSTSIELMQNDSQALKVHESFYTQRSCRDSNTNWIWNSFVKAKSFMDFATKDSFEN